MKNSVKIFLLILVLLYHFSLFAQGTQKKIQHNTHSWISINNNIFLNRHIFILADAHIRENGFFDSNSFIFGRVGLGYQQAKGLSVVLGYANLLSTPTTEGWKTRSDENRIFQQIQLNTNHNKFTVLQRLRNEQRWQQVIVNDKKTGDNKFTNRVRYLLSISYKAFNKGSMPQFVLADECMLQFGRSIVYNTFDQNRIFIGIKQKINNNLSFDMGYMSLFQQKSDGLSYNQSNTYRLFFYYVFPHEKQSVKK